MNDASDDRERRFLDDFLKSESQVRAYIFSLLPNAKDAEDVFQATSLVLWRKFDEFLPGTNFLAWACAVALNEVRRSLRNVRRDRLQFDPQIVEVLADQQARRGSRTQAVEDALRRCLEQLKDHDRQLVHQAYAGNTSIKAIAAEWGRSVRTLYNRLYQIRRSLGQCVRQRLDAEGAGS